MTTLKTLAFGCAAVFCCALMPDANAEGFGNALDASTAIARVPGRPAYTTWPLTFECRIKLKKAQAYNVIAACEPKSSPLHWELFTFPGTGHLMAYLPGCKPDHARSTVSVTDDAWHYVALVMAETAVRLYVDGAEAANLQVKRDSGIRTTGQDLTIGALNDLSNRCNGAIDETRLSSVARTIQGVPTAPFEPDADTIGLWHFDETKAQNSADASSLKNPALLVQAGPQAATGALADPNAAPRGTQVGVISPEPDVKACRALLVETLKELKLPSLEKAGETRDAVLADWDEHYWHLGNQLSGAEKLPQNAAEQTYDNHALVRASDGDQAGVVLRRSAALTKRLKQLPGAPDVSAFERDCETLAASAAKVPASDPTRRKGLYLAACALNRQVAFANPLLDFDEILFVARGVYNGSRKMGLKPTSDSQGQHFQTQYFAFNSIPGGGVFTVKNFRGTPEIRNLLSNAVVESGRLKGRKLEPGAFISPDLSSDGKTVLFSYTENKEHRWEWNNQTTWHVFKIGADGSALTQLTDGPVDDFDACWLPSGRIAFLSERRGGYIRCFDKLEVPQHTLHSMKADGSDVYPISYFETGEFTPSVNNEGMLVYTRWDYVDRENCQGSNFWICGPDGSDPRAPHGNYPYPWHTFPDNRDKDSRMGRPYTEMNIRAVPNSHLYILTAAPHHGEAFGSLCMLDLRVPDDSFMSQLKRITPYVRFPESEIDARLQYPYGMAWPLSEDFYLCNWWENLYLLDRFGNQTLLCENSLAFGGTTDWRMRLIDPIPLKARKSPPVVPSRTNQGKDARPDAPHATIALMNVYDTDQPFPPGTKVKSLRIVQNMPKTNAQMADPKMGYHWENTPRIPLGIVPVEEDGSAYFEAPVERELIFQALDENHMAVQSMRSVAYVHPGEQLTCQGCHEKPQNTPVVRKNPMAMRRAPSRLEPEAGPVEPITFFRSVKPVFERSCVGCHQKENKGPIDMAYEKLEPYAFYFSGGMRGSVTIPIHGGTRSIPGRVGARNSRMGRSLLDQWHKDKVPQEDYLRVVIWLDCNSLRLGAFNDEKDQVAGKLVWPLLDVDPKNPQGLERLRAGSAGSADGDKKPALARNAD
ncbi:MAG TPA: LamG-like jellyroll fold domain-containing protein [Planctomycetota bacterium]|jgi:hypothetical protein